MYVAALVPPSMSTTKLVVTLASFKDPIGEKIVWSCGQKVWISGRPLVAPP